MDAEQRDLLHSLAVLHLACGQERRALALLLLAVEEWPDDPGLLRALAYAHTATGGGELAVAVLDRLKSFAAPLPTDLLLRARALHRQERTLEARRCFAAYVAGRDRTDDPASEAA